MLNGYKVVKNFISPSFADYLKNYFTVIAENGHCKGGDDQAPNSYCIYGDPAFDTLMLMTCMNHYIIFGYVYKLMETMFIVNYNN